MLHGLHGGERSGAWNVEPGSEAQRAEDGICLSKHLGSLPGGLCSRTQGSMPRPRGLFSDLLGIMLRETGARRGDMGTGQVAFLSGE